MRLEFRNIINKHKNKPCVFLAHGGSLDKYDIGEITKDKVIVACNMWFRHFTFVPDYWVLCNMVTTVPVVSEKLKSIYDKKKKKPILCYADSVDETNKKSADKILNGMDYLSYDQRNFDNKNRKTIQEELQNYCKQQQHFSTGHTVAVYAIALCILLGCNPIEIYGLDLDYRTGYYKTLHDFDFEKYSHVAVIPGLTILDPTRLLTENDLSIIIKGANDIGIEVKRKS